MSNIITCPHQFTIKRSILRISQMLISVLSIQQRSINQTSQTTLLHSISIPQNQHTAMVVSTTYQLKIMIGKNFLIMRKTNELVKNLFVPILVFGLLLAGSIHVCPDSTADVLRPIAQGFIPYTLLMVCRAIIQDMVEEKSSKQKEIQKIMGVKNSSYMLGWLLTDFIRLLQVSVIFLGLSMSFGVLQTSNDSDLQLVFGFCLFGLASMAQMYLLSVFFSSSRTAAGISVLLNVVGAVLCNQFNQPYVQENPWLCYLFSIVPSTCYARITSPLPLEFGKNDALLMLGVNTVVYFTLYFYCDMVIPNEYGTHKSPLFFLKLRREGSKVRSGSFRYDLSLPLREDEEASQSAVDTSSAIFHEKMNVQAGVRRSVEIVGLEKSFGEMKAVNGVTLSIYESQLLCLLGHNGAGKTTTIGLVTGLLTKDAGTVNFYGKSLDSQLDEIRQFTGICVQKDVLYDELTVEEHLRYYGQMKGYSGQELEEELEYILGKCVLLEERNKSAKQLSGGNKRKLSLAMALIGKSKVVFLDEPTSGMDPVTRRTMWDILQEVKREQRTLILTTHHLDEAEVLSERIAIMAKGKLLTVGSADFIKRNFGIGYHLNIYRSRNDTSDWQQKKDQIVSFVKREIESAQLSNQSSQDAITILLPTQNKKDFLPIFERLEQDKSIQLDLAMTTLEEAFINIGMDEERFMKQQRRVSNNIQDADSTRPKEHDLLDFSHIPVPSCLHNRPTYHFWNQFQACLIRKAYTLKQRRKFILQGILPLYFAVVTGIQCWQIRSQMDQDAFVTTATFIINGNMSTSLCLSASTIVGLLVEEREQKLKYALNVMGCRVLPYWLATCFLDTAIAFSQVAVFIIIAVAFSITEVISLSSCLIYFATQFAFVGYSYALSWLYSSANMAYKSSFFLCLALFYMAPFIPLIILQTKFMLWLCAIFSPLMAMVEGLLVGIPNINLAAVDNRYAFVAILVIQGVGSFLLCLYIDTRSLRTAIGNNIQIEQPNEQNVQQEAQRVMGCNDSVRTLNLCKQYANGFTAVKGTSFGIDKGQVFGLLGPNGAGKSTTFNMITSRLKPTSGKVLLLNQEAQKGNSELYQNVGICPQFDCLWPTLTPVEHLKIFALLKGLKGDDVNQSIEYFLRIMQLEAYTKTHSTNLSGGNKRKLCVAIGLIGSPCMQFFDEPSSGVDPIARRFLWNTINQGLKINESAVVLTTHSMDEAEGLCHKIGIQVNGQFVCMGSPQELKLKYGSGYRITLEVVADTAEVKRQALERFPQMTPLDIKNPNQLCFQFPNQGFTFYATFDFFLKLQSASLISDFQIVQSSLEQVFMYFASFQEVRPEAVFVPKKQGLFQACTGNDEDD